MSRWLIGVAVGAVALGSPASASAKTYLGCANGDYTVMRGKVKPRNCVLPAYQGTGLALRSMRWRSWGGSTTYGRGTIDGFPGKVKAYAPVRVRGATCYTKVRYRVASGVYRAGRFPKCGTGIG